MPPTPLTNAPKLRYSRQRVLPMIGDAGQAKICDAHVAVDVFDHPAAALALSYLVAAGIRELSLVGKADDEAAVRLCTLLRGMRPDVTVTVVAKAPTHAVAVPPLAEAPDVALWQTGRLLLALAAGR